MLAERWFHSSGMFEHYLRVVINEKWAERWMKALTFPNQVMPDGFLEKLGLEGGFKVVFGVRY